MDIIKKIKSNKLSFALIAICLILIIFIILTCLIFFKDTNSIYPEKTVQISEPIVQDTQPIEKPKKNDITVNIVSIGDIMCHSTNFKAAYKNGTYDFSSVFVDIMPYVQNADIAIGNLETTFAGAAKGYSGYPTFNTPANLAR